MWIIEKNLTNTEIDPNNERLLELRNRAGRDQKNMEDNQEEEVRI